MSSSYAPIDINYIYIYIYIYIYMSFNEVCAANSEMLTSLMPWWCHQMETFSALVAICAGNHRSPVNSPHKGQCPGASMFSLICAWINAWVNNREAGDLRRYCSHHDVTVMANMANTSDMIVPTAFSVPGVFYYSYPGSLFTTQSLSHHQMSRSIEAGRLLKISNHADTSPLLLQCMWNFRATGQL